MGRILPSALCPGDTVAVVAPSGPCEKEALVSGLSRLSQRYKVKVPDRLFQPHTGYLCGDDRVRGEELAEAVKDPDTRAIFCARGGYGSVRLLHLLEDCPIAEDPKPLCGFSDITVLLHHYLASQVVSFHGPVVTQLHRLDPDHLTHLFRLLEDPGYRPLYSGTPSASRVGSSSRLAGELWGGNLTVLASLAGTRLLRPPSSAILALEDINEPPYKLDRMLTQLHEADVLDTARGAVLGSFLAASSSSRVRAGNEPLLRVMEERLDNFGIERVSGMPWGHGRKNMAWPLGVVATLDLGAANLRIEAPCVGSSSI